MKFDLEKVRRDINLDIYEAAKLDTLFAKYNITLDDVLERPVYYMSFVKEIHDTLKARATPDELMTIMLSPVLIWMGHVYVTLKSSIIESVENESVENESVENESGPNQAPDESDSSR